MSRIASYAVRIPAGLGLARLRGRARPAADRAAVATGWQCPDCGLAAEDPVDVRLGFCRRCSDFTGMCGAGRKVLSPDMMSVTTWHLPCTSRGVVAWQLTVDGSDVRALLCADHDRQVRGGQASWIAGAVPSFTG